MKIKRGVFAGIILVLTITFLVIPPFANGQTVATTFFAWVREEFQRVWTAIADLNIKAKQPHLVDANGQDLGLLLDTEPYQSFGDDRIYSVFIPRVNVIVDVIEWGMLGDPSQEVSLSAPQHSPDFPLAVHFTEAYCTGSAFTDRPIGDKDLVDPAGVGVEPRYFKFAGSVEPSTSVSQLSGNGCNTSTGNFPEAFQLQEIIPPFTEPLAWPLRIENR